MAIVYMHKRKLDSVVFYIGIGKSKKRAYSKSSRSKFWKDYTNKNEYLVEITHTDIIWEEACVIEKYLIAFYGRRDLRLGTLINLTDGGEGQSNPTSLVRKNMSEVSKNRIYTAETRQKMSNSAKGNKSSLGIKRAEETKEKLRLANVGKKYLDDVKRKLSLMRKGKSHSEEHKKNISKSKQNISIETRLKLSAANKGRKFSEEHKKKLSEAKKRKK